ncbi:MAG: DUF5667 domain-containing protein, partial [Candidatus Pacebacteria bacterium]|nr:DUF5667 domain-containing protein [Candidatus Paceibacterota bacterium]
TTATTSAAEDVDLDEEVQAQDLGVTRPNILPDSPFYFLKELSRNIQSIFAFNSLAKAKLQEKFSNEKLVELKTMIEQNQDDKKIEKALQNYQGELDGLKKAAEKVKETAGQSEEVGKFLDKFIQQQTLQQKILQKLETQVSTTTLEKITEAREQHLKRFGEVMNKLETNKEQLQERLEQNLQEVAGSEFKNFKNLEILQQLEEKVPEEAKDAVQKAAENALKRLKGDLEKMSPDDQARFKEYINSIIGDKETQLEILDSLKEELKTIPQLKENLLQIRENVMNTIRERLQVGTTTCEEVEEPAANFCEKGRIVISKDDKGCVVEFKCVIPAETEESTSTPQPSAGTVCITLWDPVCGENGETYSNECYAKKAGVEIDYDGACGATTTGEKEQNEGENTSIQNQLQQFKELLNGLKSSNP